DETGSYTAEVPAHYELAAGQAASTNYTFTDDDTDDVTIHLTHAIDHTSTTTTRTINYVITDGDSTKAPAPTTQTMSWNVTTDEVTGTSYASPAGAYLAVTGPAVEGYTADNTVAAEVPAPTLTSRLANTTATITYHTDDAALTVHYVDDGTGEQVGSTTLTGTVDGTGTYKVTAPAHYVLADGQAASVDYTFATDDTDDITVHLTHAIDHTTTTTTRTVNYVFAGSNQQAADSVTQTLTWDVLTDEVTGQQQFVPVGEYAAVQSPTVHGYTANGNAALAAVAATTTTPTNAADVTITYTANPATLTVHYVDDNTGEQVASATVDGVVDGMGTYTVQSPTGYVLASGQAASVAYTLTTDDTDDVTVHLNHAINYTTATTTRTVNYTINGQDAATNHAATQVPASVTQTVNWSVATDAVTGAIVATPQSDFAAVTSPALNGYTADGDAAAVTLGTITTDPTDATTTTINYTPDQEALTVHYVDDVTGEQVTSAVVNGVMDATGDYTVTVPQGYTLANGQAEIVSYQLTNDGTDDITVHLTHAIAHTTTTTTRTVNYVIADGDQSKAPAPTTQTMAWNVTTDEVTGTSFATPTEAYAAVTAPTVAGYTADGNVAAAVMAPTATSRLANTTTTVTYHADDAALTVHYVDDVTGEQVASATLHGKVDGQGQYTVSVPDHYALADGQAAELAYTFTNDGNDDLTVHLTHAIDRSTATTTRTITYVMDNGDTAKAPQVVTQTATWNVATDAVTGTSVATATGYYAAVDSPAVAGYTASGNVAAGTLGAVAADQLANTNTTVHYTADAASLNVTYVDDVTGATLSSTTLTGTTDGTGTYTVTVPANYELADGQSSSVNYTFAPNTDNDITIHLTHAVNHSTATTTRTIHYVIAGGDTTKAPADQTQTITWNVTTDAVTGTSYATAQDAYGAVTAPTVAGYTADHDTDAQVMGPVAADALADTTTTVTYTPDDANITVTYVDDAENGQTVETQSLQGTVDGQGTYTVTVPGGYQLVEGQSRSVNYTFATDDSDNITVHLTHHMTAGTATTTRTINYVVDGGGAPAPASVTQTAIYGTTTDDVTGLTTATTDGTYGAVVTPALAGYTADQTQVAAATPDYTAGDTSVTVHYTANPEQLHVRYVDDVTGAT
ncbi:mucin-binding protein, partial [Lacticaseibacillus thailandensis]